MMVSLRRASQVERLGRLLSFDEEHMSGPDELLAGVDEAGRGPLAGPVVAAAVILRDPAQLIGLNDSKKVSPAKREKLFFEISKTALVGIGMVDEKKIDEINIFQAARQAMKKAVMSLSQTPSFLLIDGPIKLGLPVTQKGIVGGDRKSASIAAASIVAKVFRDQWMRKIHEQYPAYGFDAHKGYGTLQHMEALRREGPCPVHRTSFGPVRVAMNPERKGHALSV